MPTTQYRISSGVASFVVQFTFMPVLEKEISASAIVVGVTPAAVPEAIVIALLVRCLEWAPAVATPFFIPIQIFAWFIPSANPKLSVESFCTAVLETVPCVAKKAASGSKPKLMWSTTGATPVFLLKLPTLNWAPFIAIHPTGTLALPPAV